MRIVITDGYTLNPGDLSWDAFKELGRIDHYDRTAPALIADRCKNAEIIITNKTPVDAAVIEMAANLKIIAVTATGYNIIDIKAAKARGIIVCNVPEYGTYSVAQHTIALLLELTNRVGRHAQSVAQGEWSKSIDWSYSKTPVIELKDKVLGIIGLGKIGEKTAEIALALGMDIIYYRGHPQKIKCRYVPLEELFSTSDFVSLHCPLTPDNQGFVNRHLLKLMKPSAFLVNTSRGQLINEHDLAEALKKGLLAGAALDVLSKEPPPEDHPLPGLPNCLITPHNAWLSFEARQRIMQTTSANVRAALSGNPQNRVA
jgi:glycerate dehydrogenase